jgi:hypothetical protein
MHGDQRIAACALAGLLGDRVALAVVLAITDIIDLALVRCHDQSYGNDKECNRE